MDRRKVVVIGAGVVGLACGLSLQQQGADVTLIDPGAPGEGVSAGNPGAISLTSIAPVAVPGVLAKVPGWLLDPNGPLVLRWRHLPTMLPWLVRFALNTSRSRSAAAMAALASLTLAARPAWQPLLAAADAEALLRDCGHLIVYRSRAAHDADAAGWKTRADLGFSSRTVAGTELRDLEPELAPDFVIARLVEGNGHVVDPLGLSRALAAAIRRGGGAVVADSARGFALSGRRVVGVRGDRARYDADLVVLAAGARSAALAATVGDRVPLEPERGYNATVTDPPITLARPVFSPADKVLAASMTPGLRFAGTAEFAGFAAAPDLTRADGLLATGRRLFPALGRDPLPSTPWSGFRPSTPDSLPVIGPATRVGGLVHAFGHGHLGLTTAAITAAAVAALAAGVPPPVSLAPFSPARF